MSNSKLIEAARKAKGSRILPTVNLGQRYDAEELLLAMADALQACEWSHDMEAAPRDGTKFEGRNKTHGAHTCWIPESMAHYKKATALYGSRAGSNSVNSFTPTAWRIITLPEETQ